MKAREEDSMKWSVILGITVVLAGVTGFMVANQEEFFPDAYKPEHPALKHINSKDSTQLKHDSTEHHR